MGKEPRRKFYLKEFKAISHALSTYGDLNLLINHLVEGTAKTFEAKGCCIMLFDESENQLFTVSSYGISDDYLSKGPLLVDNKYCAFVRGEPMFIEDLSTDDRVHYPDAAKKEGRSTWESFAEEQAGAEDFQRCRSPRRGSSSCTATSR